MKQSVFFILLIFILNINIYASEVLIDGSTSYRVMDDKILLSTEKIINKSEKSKSGTLKIKLYATEFRYYGGPIDGYVLGEYTFSNVLDSGEYFYDTSQKVNCNRPPNGKYYMTMVLLEYEGDQYKIIDFQNYFYKKSFGIDEVVISEKTTTENSVVENTSSNDDNETNSEEEKEGDKPYSFKDDSRSHFLLGIAAVGTLRNILNIQ